MKTRIALASGLFLCSLGSAHASNAPCDASVPIKGCNADVSSDGKTVTLRSSTPRCSVIEWSIDGYRKTTTVIDGQQRLELLTTKAQNLNVESCTEVKDLRSVSSQGSRGSSGTTQLQVLFRPSPADFYPPVSVRMGEQGRVRIRVCYNTSGRVVSSDIDSTSGSPHLDGAAVKMGGHYRFSPAMMDGAPLEGCVAIPITFALSQ